MGPPEQQAIQVVVDTGSRTELWVTALGALAAVAGMVTAWVKRRRG